MVYSALDEAALQSALREWQAGSAVSRLSFGEMLQAIAWLRANGFDLVSTAE